LRTRVVTNENGDENSGTTTTRLTRAKAASLSIQANAKPTNAAVAAVPATRKRAALGDVSNVHKADPNAMAGGDKKPIRKIVKATTASKIVVKAGSKPTRATRAAPLKTAPTTQDTKDTKDTKKDTTGSGGARAKKRQAPSKIKEEEEEENEIVVSVTKLAGVEIEKVTNPPAAKRPRIDRPKRASEVEGWEDLDADDADDPLMVSEYVNEIFDYLKRLEPETQPNPNYMDDQNDLKWQMRGILVDWLVEVHTRFRLLPETLFLAVNIIDRFLSHKIVLLDKLELVGITAMFIAAKYEEVFSPHVQYFRHVADDGFTEEEILRAERFILATLDYNLSYPNPMNFLRRISKADQYDFQTRTFAKYLMEISLLDHRFMPYLSSHVSAAAMYMSRMMLHRGPWV
jgi:hypothetical protein